ncbi:ComF family protein [Nocardioides litoris]|uniref:ComF family protein n=1 Tax=Nocardioides litoris TaxID=1926648 RepID=UPI001B85FC48|nr:ComF family protein [Nocardioides litoris]
MTGSLHDAAVDLLLGGSCLGCARPGRLVCVACAAALPRGASPRWPTPVPPGLVTPFAAASYDGLVRALVLGHKEHRLLALAPVLGVLLATAVAAALDDAGASGPVLLVPVPSRAAAVRARGHDPTRTMARQAARRLASAGRSAEAVALLRTRPGVADQAGLDREARRANLAGSMAVRGRVLAALARRGTRAHVVLCDDVLTTGSTAREAQRALEVVGVRPLAVACVAATRLHSVSSADSAGGEVPPPGPTH